MTIQVKQLVRLKKFPQSCKHPRKLFFFMFMSAGNRILSDRTDGCRYNNSPKGSGRRVFRLTEQGKVADTEGAVKPEKRERIACNRIEFYPAKHMRKHTAIDCLLYVKLNRTQLEIPLDQNAFCCLIAVTLIRYIDTLDKVEIVDENTIKITKPYDYLYPAFDMFAPESVCYSSDTPINIVRTF
ncbi:hypothetical protein KQX54_021577 [Cotesia glomerata]|uniref:Uncharacterized protein n=1 Tax=Cotesia glomerata TaxID=32391 RepID=A0AAV7JA40_COTGL|nr:hypothetical protein KQX54_021577 [Cotesia glomerata]